MSPNSPSRLARQTPAELITPEQRDAWFALLFAHSTVTDRIDRVLQDRHRLSFSAYEILCRLHGQDEPQSVRSLAEQLVSVSPTRASRLVQELVDAGHLQRGADQGDGRKSLIGFTREGRRYADKVSRSFEEAVLTYFIDPLDDEDIAAIARIWEKLQATQASSPPAVTRRAAPLGGGALRADHRREYGG
jgi:DNA-binding MarR family transcriptional regulator